MIEFLIISTIAIFIILTYATHDKWEPLYGPTIGGVVAFIYFLVLAGGISIAAASKLKSTCFKAGYPDSRMTWNLKGYCVKRVDQTDIVVPVESLGAGR